MTFRLAMWSGPRNISTAMMRAWENREDCEVVDEPFYSCYLKETGLKHPMWEEILAAQSSNWEKVAEQLCDSGSVAPIYYQKQMTHHILRGVSLKWTKKLSHCFLIRDPYEVVSSYREKMDTINEDDIGIIRQWELYQEISELTQQRIPVIDATQVLKSPESTLRAVCNHFNLDFSVKMLQWPAGKRSSDGVWAPHWYQVVEQSSDFAPYKSKQLNLTQEQSDIANASVDAYSKMKEHMIAV